MKDRREVERDSDENKRTDSGLHLQGLYEHALLYMYTSPTTYRCTSTTAFRAANSASCNRRRTAVRRSSHASPFGARRISNEVKDYSTELETALKAALLYKKVKSARHTCRHQREDQT